MKRDPGAEAGPAPSSVWTASLVGRRAELGELERERRRAETGEFRAVLLVGEPGVGKTRLAGEVLTGARGRATVLSARGYPLGGSVPLGLWAEAFEGHLRGAEAGDVVGLCGGFVDDLAVLLRGVAAARRGVPAAAPPLPRLQEGLAVVLANLTAQRPVVVFLDDAHDADASSWRFLDYLARQLGQARLLVVAAARAGELSQNDAANEVVLRLEQEGRLARLPLSVLSREAIAALAENVLAREPSPALVDWLAGRSLGNPLYALSLLGGLIEEGADLSSPVLRSLPEGLAERVGTRLRHLDEASLHVLETMAVVGRGLDAGDLAGTCGGTLDRLAPALDRLGRCGLVSEEERGRHVTFDIVHPLIRDTVYEGLAPRRRRALHRAVGRALFASARVGEAAPHFALAADVGDDEAIRVLLGALDEAERRQAYHEAMKIVCALVDLLAPGDHRWLEVLDAMSSHAPWVLDHGAGEMAGKAVRAMREIAALLDATDDPRRAAVKLRLASLLGWGRGELDEALGLAEDAARLFEVAGDRQNALLAGVEVAAICGIGGDLAAMEERGRDVARRAEAEGERFATVQARRTEGWAAWFRGRFPEAEAAFRRSVELGGDDAERHRVGQGLAGVALTLAWQGEVEKARLLLAEARAANPAHGRGMVLDWAILVDWIAGDFRAAVPTAREALRSRPSGPTARRSVGLAVASMAATELGALATAEEWLANARSCLHHRPFFGYREICLWAEAAMRHRSGDLDRSLALLAEASTATVAMGARTPASGILFDLVEVAVEADRLDVASDAAGELARVAGAAGAHVYPALAGVTTAMVATASGERAPALHELRHAVDVIAAAGWRWYLGRSLVVLGRALAHADRAGAVAALQQAAATFEACGSEWRRERALALLRTLGSRGRKAAAASLGPGALSRREGEVARLAAQGRTARQIGEQLCIGERTVEWHLANAYAKLGVDSRLELARRLSETTDAR